MAAFAVVTRPPAGMRELGLCEQDPISGVTHAFVMFRVPRAEALSNVATEALHAAGVDAAERADHDTGVLFLDDASPEHCDLVRDLSHEGAVRLLVVVPWTEALCGPAAWVLIDAGASDV